jgi:5-methylcytosine-specific restriction enzyme A
MKPVVTITNCYYSTYNRTAVIESLLIDRYERDPEARRACLDHYGYRCQACKKTMSEIYGNLGDAYIHVHHKVPLSDIREEYQVDPIRDLVPVCPNCHAMLHRSRTVLSVEELAEMVLNRRRGAG